MHRRALQPWLQGAGNVSMRVCDLGAILGKCRLWAWLLEGIRMRYRKRHAVVDAVRWFAHGDHPLVERRGEDWVIATLEGWRRVNPGDWIVTDDSRNTWPMADEMFRLLYEQECVYPTDVS